MQNFLKIDNKYDIAGVIGRRVYYIRDSSLNEGYDISGNFYPWDGFISETVR